MENPDVVRWGWKKPDVPKESAKPSRGNSPKTYGLVRATKEKTYALNPNAKSFEFDQSDQS